MSAHGIGVKLPAGFEGKIFRRTATSGVVCYPVAQFASFPLPANVADFGGGAVDLMGINDVFVVLFEYGPESAGQRLFERRGMPRELVGGDFKPYTLRRGLGGQSGTQWFFTEAGRPFTLYAVLGSHARRSDLVPRVNALLRSIVVSPTNASGTPAA